MWFISRIYIDQDCANFCNGKLRLKRDSIIGLSDSYMRTYLEKTFLYHKALFWIHSILFWHHIPILSPGFRPWATSPAAILFVSSSNCSNVLRWLLSQNYTNLRKIKRWHVKRIPKERFEKAIQWKRHPVMNTSLRSLLSYVFADPLKHSNSGIRSAVFLWTWGMELPMSVLVLVPKQYENLRIRSLFIRLIKLIIFY